MKSNVSNWTRLLAILLLGGASASCHERDATGVRPIGISLIAEATSAAVGESVTVRFEATGTDMLGVLISWGDGVVDSVTAGEQVVEMSGPLTHTWEIASTYVVIGTVETARLGVASDEVTIRIN